MRPPLSLALRLTLLFAVASTVIFVVFGWLITGTTATHFEAEDNAELELVAKAVHRAISESGFVQHPADLSRRFDDILVGHHHAALVIVGERCEPVYGSLSAGLTPIACAPRPVAKAQDQWQEARWSDGEHNYRALARQVEIVSIPYTIAVSVPIDFHERFMESFQRTLWLMIGVSVAIMSLLAWVAVRHGHAPLHAMVRTIGQIRAADLNARLAPESLPSDLRGLADSVNALLRRVEDAFHRLSDFNADVAHELRTPVTNLLAQTQVALSRSRTAEAYRDILYSNVEEFERLATMITDMLFLAKADHGALTVELASMDLRTEVLDLFAYYDVWADERGVALTLNGTGTVCADRHMLRRALGNLLSNAIRHTAAGGAVCVNIDPSTVGTLRIAIENPGTEIPAEHLPKLFDRFHRVDPSRQRNGDGAGLGLAIVKSIVERHGGVVSAACSEGVTRFSVVLPLGGAAGPTRPV